MSSQTHCRSLVSPATMSAMAAFTPDVLKTLRSQTDAAAKAGEGFAALPLKTAHPGRRSNDARD